jgi:hypothetical protein
MPVILEISRSSVLVISRRLWRIWKIYHRETNENYPSNWLFEGRAVEFQTSHVRSALSLGNLAVGANVFDLAIKIFSTLHKR